MNKLILITTKGCEGCVIARNNIKEAIVKTSKDVTFELKDCEEVSKKYMRTFGIRDFPTILLFKDDELKLKHTGSVPTIVVLRWIDIHF